MPIKMTLKEKIRQGQTVLGTWNILPSPAVTNVLAKAGLDFVLIDMEHGLMDYHTAAEMVMAAQAEDCATLIRVGENNEMAILKALETGTNGVIVPHIETVKDREQAIAAVKYPPLGNRGFTPYTRAGGYAYAAHQTNRENTRTITGIIVEGKRGIDNLSEILKAAELDLVYLGSYDLSVALGVPGEVTNPKVKKILEKAVKIIHRYGKSAGALFHTLEEYRYFRSLGVNFLCYRVDTDVLFAAFHSMLAEIDKGTR